MLPARQHLKSDGLRGVEIDQGLVIGNDLTGSDGVLDFHLELDALLQSFIHGPVEEAVAPSSLGLGPIHGHVGFAEGGVNGSAVSVGHGLIAGNAGN